MNQCHGGRIGPRIVNFFLSWDSEGASYYDRCTAEATCRVVAGCIHEHVLAWPSCAGCAALAVERWSSGEKGRCPKCMGGIPEAQRHACPILLQAEPLPQPQGVST